MPLLSEATALYFGDTQAKKVYQGDTLVWEQPTEVVEGPPPMQIPGMG